MIKSMKSFILFQKWIFLISIYSILTTIVKINADYGEYLLSKDEFHPLHPINNPFFELSSFRHKINRTQQSVARSIMDLYHRYYQQHNILRLRSEPRYLFCKRKFVRVVKSTAMMNCVSGIGNQLGSFFQDFLYAVVTNRTFSVPSHTFGGECKYGFSLYPWIPTHSEIEEMIRERCNKQISGRVLDMNKCGVLEIDDLSVDPASNHEFNSHYLIFNRKWDHSISDQIMNRINILFQPTFYDNSRIHAYGLIQLYTVNMSRVVIDIVKDIWSKTISIPNSIRISLHIRHFGINEVKYTKEQILEKVKWIDDHFVELLSHMRSKFDSKKCFIYLATEREQTIQRIEQVAKEISCIVYYIDRNNTMFTQSDVQTTIKKAEMTETLHFRNPDHGEYGKGMLPFADILLLQKGDLFLGATISTFSLLVANVLGFHGLMKGYNISPTYWNNGVMYKNETVLCVHRVKNKTILNHAQNVTKSKECFCDPNIAYDKSSSGSISKNSK